MKASLFSAFGFPVSMRDDVDLSQPISVPASVRGIVVSLYLAFRVLA